ncbi:MAG: DUF3298 domain-containing protein [Candidatus Kaiserbacteria bacterium]|nr:MAG: DUF3298 domain-containing protein [Candidatus Kaiserbacteria bacterium]
MSRILAYVFAAIVVLGGAYLLLTKSPAQNADSITAQSIVEQTAAYTIDAKYPQVGNPAIDADIEATVRAAVEEFKTYPQNPPDSAVPQNEFIGLYDEVYTGADVVSVELIFSEYTGGAHPNAAIVGLNYNPATGAKVTLDEALSMIGLSLSQVAAKAQAQFETDLADAYFPEGAEPTLENYGTFVVSADAVTFIFQNYQVAPYAAGPQEVSFSRVR